MAVGLDLKERTNRVKEGGILSAVSTPWELAIRFSACDSGDSVELRQLLGNLMLIPKHTLFRFG